MRKKIEELRNREEGFTLVELLAVIVILGLIVAIAIPAIGKVIDKVEENTDTAEVQMVVDAARLYYTSNPTATGDVTTQDLLDDGYLEPRADGTIENVTVTKDATTGEISYVHDATTPVTP